jgi:hypothetical protein
MDPGPARLAYPQSWNRYTYSGSDPINANDPSGRDWGPYGCFGSLDELLEATSDASIGCPNVPDGFILVLKADPAVIAAERIEAIVGEDLNGLEGLGDVANYQQASYGLSPTYDVTFTASALGSYEESLVNPATVTIIEATGPIGSAVGTVLVGGYVIYKIWAYLKNNPAVPAPWPNFQTVLEELTKPGSTWKWNGSKWEQDCPPGSPKQIQTLHWNPPDQYHQFGHYDYVDCNGHSWSVWGDGTMTPNK